MAPTSRSSTKNLETEAPPQAVVLADSFNERFRPITLDKPRCLLPLCNTPLIEYTLEFLAVAGVQEIVLFCREHAEQIKSYLKDSKWCRTNSPIKITTIVTQARSVGDVLRELDSKQLVDSDFILVSGDVVSNIHLKEVLEAHSVRKAADKNAIMTMVVKEASPFHRTRGIGECSIFVLDGQTNECVHYEAIDAFPRKRRMMMDLEVFEKHSEVQIRNDLIDCQIDVCSVEVPALFTENFDYQDIRKDFVFGILTSDLLGKTIYCHIVKEAYAARVRSLETYDAISKDILSRWTYPIVPDSNLQEQDCYEYMRGQIYKEQDVVLSRSCVLGEKVLIGAKTEIAENSKITNTVIGRNVQIGPNATIDGAYLWDNVVIKANCSVLRSILANGVVLEENVTINKGCILSFGVVIGPNVELPAYTKLTTHTKPSTSESNTERETNQERGSIEFLGSQGSGHLWTDETSEAEDEQDPRNLKVSSLAFDMSNLSISESESSASVIDSGSDNESTDLAIPSPQEIFQREVTQTLERAFSEGHSVEIAALELNTLRMASNTTFHDLRTVVIPSILGQIDTQKITSSSKEVLKKWAPLIGKLILSPSDQLDVLYILQEHCANTPSHFKLLAPSLRLLYELDVIEEDAIIRWYDSDRSKGTIGSNENIKKLRDLMSPFITWLQEAEEESDNL